MGTPWHWIEFNLFVIAALALDLDLFHRRAHAIRLREAALWSSVWIALSILFGLGIYYRNGSQPALEFFTGYLIEKALSVDNLFIFLVIFRAFSVDERVQHRVLAWGVLGALVMRGAMIAVGAALISRFTWILYLFGVFLLYAGGRMLFAKGSGMRPEQSRLFRWASRWFPITHQYREHRFFVLQEGRRYVTPLFLVLLVVEIIDVTFALDSIPAVFGVTRDVFIVYTSNVFAILGLRALYFLLAGVLRYFRFLKAGLSAVLLFIGAKMLAEPWLHLPAHVALAVVGGILAVAMLASWVAGPAKLETGSPDSFLPKGED